MRGNAWPARFASLALLVAAAATLAGCMAMGEPASDARAEELLSRSVSNLNDDYAFYGSSTAKRNGNVVSEQSSTYTRQSEEWVSDDAVESELDAFAGWNPVEALEMLPDWSKRVYVDQEESNGAWQVVVAQPDAKAVKAWIRDRLAGRMERFVRDEAAAASDPERARAVLRQQVQQLDDLMERVSLEAEFRVWIDRGDMLPKRLEAATALNYTNERTTRRETINGTYELGKSHRENIITEVEG